MNSIITRSIAIRAVASFSFMSFRDKTHHHPHETSSTIDHQNSQNHNTQIATEGSFISQLFNKCFISVVSIKSWAMSLLKWKPTSPEELELTEKKLLSYLKNPYKGYFVDIGRDNYPPTDDRLWTIEIDSPVPQKNNQSPDENKRSSSESLPLVMIHGFGAGVGIWTLNLDSLSQNRKVYAFDILGFGRSSRPKMRRGEESEIQMVESIERWRSSVGLNSKFILLGHSFGAYLALSYALQFPEKIAHLILADPWGLPSHQVATQTAQGGSDTPAFVIPTWVKIVARVVNTFNPLAILRVAGPWGPALVQKARPDIRKKFETLFGEEDADLILNYIYHCNAQDNPTGETAFKSLILPMGWAKYPMIQRVGELHSDIELTFIHGSKSWIDRQPAIQIKYLLSDRSVEIHVIPGAGHHVYADKHDTFNQLVNGACLSVDERMGRIAAAEERKSLHDED